MMALKRHAPSIRKLPAISRSSTIPSSVIPNVAISVAASVRSRTFGTCQAWKTVRIALGLPRLGNVPVAWAGMPLV